MPRKTVAIRGLDTELYHEVFSMAKKDGKRVSEVVNQALEAFLNGNHENSNGDNSGKGKGANIFTLKNEGEISLSKKDILSMKKEVGAFRIETSGRLVLEKDLDRESLGSVDRIIVRGGTVMVPKGIYPQFLIRSDIYGKIEKY